MPMQQIDPRIYDDILTAGQGIGNLDPQVQHATEMAKYLRGMGRAPETRMSGRRAVAPSGMEYLGALGMQGAAGAQNQQAIGMQQQQQGLRNKQVQAVLEFLRSQQQQQAPYQPPPQFDDPQMPNASGAM